MGRGLEQVGVQPDALSHLRGPLVWDGIRAMLHELMTMISVFGSLGAVAFVVLGTARVAEQRAAEGIRPAGGAHG